MNILYDLKRKDVKTYTYQVNRGGDLHIKVSNGSERIVDIVFLNGKFSKATHQIEGAFVGTRSYWYVMGAISEKIKAIEKALKKE